MQKFLISFVAFAALSKLSYCLTAETETKTKYFVANPKSLDYKFTGKKDEHRFGVELKANKQFHHTKTAEDGVRLGCYGHELEGKKYSTHYVADGKGYRLVPDQGLITVYPKDGSEARKASFVQSFNEEEIVSANIRYFFPEGCQSPQIELNESNKLTPTERKINEIPVRVEVKVPEIRQEKSSKSIDFGNEDERVQPIERIEDKVSVKQSTPAPVDSISNVAFTTPRYLPATPSSEPTVQPSTFSRRTATRRAISSTFLPHSITTEVYTTPQEITTPQPIFTTTQTVATNPQTESTAQRFESITPKSRTLTQSPVLPLIQSITPYRNAKKCSDTCCDDNRPQILMSRASPDSCCKGVGKIVVPIEMDLLAKMSTDEIIQVTSETKNIEMLKKLLALAEKYNF